MKKFSLVAGAFILIGFAAYVAYEVYFPQMIAESITSEHISLVPDQIEHRFEKIRKPVNDGAGVVVEAMHNSGVTMDQILKAIDEAREEQAYAFLDELNRSEITSPDQVFSMAKKHFPVDFNVEIFRRPFNEKVSIATIRKGVRYANIYKDKEEFDVATAKSIVKRILLEKEEEFKRLTNIN
jgi:ABC-type xylose transport system substrate-binding protein